MRLGIEETIKDFERRYSQPSSIRDGVDKRNKPASTEKEIKRNVFDIQDLFEQMGQQAIKKFQMKKKALEKQYEENNQY